MSHEIKNQIGTILGASEVMRELGDSCQRRDRVKFLDIISANARTMRATIENLVELSRLQKDPRQHRQVYLPEAAAESVRQLRERAQGAGVEVRIGELPNVEVNAAAVELALNNLLSNAIKFSDAAKEQRTIDVKAPWNTRGRDAARRSRSRQRPWRARGSPPRPLSTLFPGA